MRQQDERAHRCWAGDSQACLSFVSEQAVQALADACQCGTPEVPWAISEWRGERERTKGEVNTSAHQGVGSTLLLAFHGRTQTRDEIADNEGTPPPHGCREPRAPQTVVKRVLRSYSDPNRNTMDL